MALAAVIRVLLFAAVTRCRCEPPNGYSQNNGNSRDTQFDNLLRPPPPPPASSNIVPVPFHGGAPRAQRQSADVGYQYQPPPSPQILSAQNFKFPAPFYKQYNFNFVPPPQPFSTTPSPTLFQKVSTWLFPSQQTSYDGNAQEITNAAPQHAPAKKECNPCNSMPWIPVIRYDLAAKMVRQNQYVSPTYGPPSPTAIANSGLNNQYAPHPFYLQQMDQKLTQFLPGIPHETYGTPLRQQQVQQFGSPSSTYGPPSATHSIDTATQNPLSSTYGVPSSSFSIPSSSYGVPSSSYNAPSSSYGVPSSSYGVPSSTLGASSLTNGFSNSISSSTYGTPTSTYLQPSSTYSPPSLLYGSPPLTSSTFGPATPNYDEVPNYDEIPNYQPPQTNDVEVFRITAPDSEQQLPKVSQPTGFKNSYGEPIANNYFDIPYPISAAAESTKVKTEILPNGQNLENQNASFALAKPAPFSMNRGRNIHTLQPVALPNLSVSPLPPIFNARPFRTVLSSQNIADNIKNINNLHQSSSNVNISPSIPVSEFSQSEYPPTFIQSPIIDIPTKNVNQSKAYRNIVNSFVINQHRDISSQASEDHVATTKTNKVKDFSFESTDVGNDLYEIPSDFRHKQQVPSNHRESFQDLRGVTDEEVDKYRTDNNLQSIDSPLLYLKPSAPHKEFDHFLLSLSTPSNSFEYELYDENPTTTSPQLSSFSNLQNKQNHDYKESLPPPPVPQADANKPKLVQIIIPYTRNQKDSKPSGLDFEQTGFSGADWASASEDEYQARKVPANTENSFYVNTGTEGYNTATSEYNTATDAYEIESTTTEGPTVSENEYYESDKLNAAAILNDLYDVKEPPFDIIKLQHNIDDWTEQQFSQHYRTTPKTRTSDKYAHAKQIPDEYFTTVNPVTNYETATNYDLDHEGSGSAHHSITQRTTISTPHKHYNTINRGREKSTSDKNKIQSDDHKPHVYTAASSFRSTATPAPWEKIQTSISPLTKEKVYVVTSKPWRDSFNISAWFPLDKFESLRTTSLDNDVSASDNLPFKSPRFLSRPSFGATSSDDTLKSDGSYAFSKDWHQSINDLESRRDSGNATTTFTEGPRQTVTTNKEEVTTITTTAEPLSE